MSRPNQGVQSYLEGSLGASGRCERGCEPQWKVTLKFSLLSSRWGSSPELTVDCSPEGTPGMGRS